MIKMATVVDTPNDTRFVHEHGSIPVLACAARPIHHLHTNNLLALQLAFACGTVHHKCAGVSLAKPTDAQDHRVTGGDTTKIDKYLGAWYGPMSDQTRDDLAKNDLRGLDNVLYLMFWDPHPGS